jgi:hypothetical protein
MIYVISIARIYEKLNIYMLPVFHMHVALQ